MQTVHGIRGNKRNWYGQLEVFSQHFTAAARDARRFNEILAEFLKRRFP